MRPTSIALLGAALVISAIGGAGAPLANSAAVAVAAPAESLLRLLEEGDAIGTGRDGRLTVLLLGSDSRGGGVARTDTIIVASLSGNSVAAVSIPRDLARIPKPGGGTFTARVNAILRSLARDQPINAALAEFERVIESLLGVEIDYHVLIKFKAFDALVEEIEPIPVRISRDVRDNKYWDNPNKPRGVYFPASNGHELYAMQPGPEPLCDGEWTTRSGSIGKQDWCRRAMPFVRSRKGPGNSDFVRARRQQNLVMAAVRRVIARGDGGALTSLLNRAKGQQGVGAFITNIPLTGSNALSLYRQLNGASLTFQTVLSPPTYAMRIPGRTGYEPRLAAIRGMAKQWLGGDGRGGAAPTAAPTADPPTLPTAAPSWLPYPSPDSTVAPTPIPPPIASGRVDPSPTAGPPPTPPPTLPAGDSPAASPAPATAASPAREPPPASPVAGAIESPATAANPPPATGAVVAGDERSGFPALLAGAFAVAALGALIVSLLVALRLLRVR